jgi:1,4-dihydroxy-2-naphthoyl-CoA hydrolase
MVAKLFKERTMSMIDLIQEHLKDLLPGLLGIKFNQVDPETVAATLKVKPELCTVGDILHGGAIMAFADTLGAVGAFLNLPQGASTTTIESKTNFTGPARVDTTITASSRMVHKGRSLMVWQTEISGEDGNLVALVTQTQMVLSVPPSTD